MLNTSDIKYAGFFTRFVAKIIDILILYIPLNIIESTFGEDSNITIFLFILILWLYESLMISSSWGATFGKKILSIKVFDVEMQKVTFKKATIRYLYSIFSYLFLLPIFMIFFTTKKQTFHDYFAKTIVLDDINRYDYKVTNKLYEAHKVEQKNKAKKKSGLRTVIIIVTILLVITPLVYVGVYMGKYMVVFYKLYSDRDKAYNYSFRTTYTLKDYNNTKIDFYNSELEKYSKNFIDADDIYSKFEADVKKDLTLECIQYFIKQSDNEKWINAGGEYRTNARNKYANTEKKIKKAKENESFMGQNFHTFDTNMVNSIQNDITQLWSDKGNSVCEQQVSADELYQTFIPLYIKKFDESNMQSTSTGFPQQRGIDWFEILKTKHPAYFQKKAEKEKAVKKIYLEAVKKMEIAEIKQKLNIEKKNFELYSKAVKEGKNSLLAAIVYKQNNKLDLYISSGHDINVKNQHGHSALFLATEIENVYAVKQLLKNAAEINSMDRFKNYTAFTWLVSKNNANMEIVKLFLDNSVDVNYQYKKSEPALTVAAKGCRNFKLVKLLLDNGADYELIDMYGHNIKTALPRYCRDKQKLAKMIKLIEDESSFFAW